MKILLIENNKLVRAALAQVLTKERYEIHLADDGQLSLDLDSGRVTLGEQIISLTATEYKLLKLFLRHPHRIFSRSAILDQIWGFDDAPTDQYLFRKSK